MGRNVIRWILLLLIAGGMAFGAWGLIVEGDCASYRGRQLDPDCEQPAP
jgi:hypothetical protein